MTSKILINAVDPDECRIAKIKDNKLEEFHFESASREITHGNIYKGVIIRIEPSLQAVFVDYGTEKNGFLQRQEIHSDYFQDAQNGNLSLQNILKRGQELLVQISKDPDAKKGAMLTTYISLPGRHIVLMPGSKTRGISRKIEDEAERKRIKEIIDGINLPEGFGIIVRTAGLECTKTTISNDLKHLMRLWKNIKEKGIKETAPALLYKDKHLVVRSIRDYFTSDVTEILIDDAEVYQEVRDFLKVVSPKDTKIVKQYRGEKPIFTKYELESQIGTIFESRVDLKSGGTIIIEKTEAMVTIDVNSGKATQKKSVEDTALTTNLEAAEEVARQLRLRDLGGLIVIDFIDMRDSKHKAQVERAMRTHVKGDKAKTKIGKISQFGLMEMSRQRLRPSIEFGSFTPCSRCKGKGLIPSTEILSLRFLRKLRLETLKENPSRLVRGIVPVDVADYLLNKKRKDLLDMENRRGITIRIESDAEMLPGEDRIVMEG